MSDATLGAQSTLGQLGEDAPPKVLRRPWCQISGVVSKKNKKTKKQKGKK